MCGFLAPASEFHRKLREPPAPLLGFAVVEIQKYRLETGTIRLDRETQRSDLRRWIRARWASYDLVFMVSVTSESQPLLVPPRLRSADAGGSAGEHRGALGNDEDPVADPSVRPTILLVDDDADIREALADTLEDYGFSVITAAHGADALRCLRGMTSLPRFILLDLMMPVMDGYMFLEERRKDPVLVSIPVAVITAGHGVDRNRLGDGTPIVPKPIKLPQLMNTLRALHPGGTAL
jgi:CheY-like chemotaxis protein